MSIICAGALGGCGSSDPGGATPVDRTATASVQPSAETPTETPAETPAEPSPTSQSPAARPPAPQPPTLAPRARELIDEAKRARRDTVVLTVSTVPGETGATARALRDLGATVESTDATVGYIRATVPIAVAAQAATLAGISRADVEEPIGVPDPTP